MKEKLLSKIDELISDCNMLSSLIEAIERNELIDEDNFYFAKFRAFRTSSLSFLANVLGQEEIYYKTFDKAVIYFKPYNLNMALELLTNIKKDINDGWLRDIKGIISAEIFSDFLEMAEHLINEGYKDPAAVIIGSILEENLRDLCSRNSIPITSTIPGTTNTKPIKAEAMNIALSKAKVYNLLVQKSITSWLELRNNAAHGKYTEYDLLQVKQLLSSVRDFAVKYL